MPEFSRNWGYLCLMILLSSCTPEEIEETNFEIDLLFPEDKTLCLEGEIIDETTSNINFRWTSIDGISSYNFFLLDNNGNILYEKDNIQDDELKVEVDRGKPFNWRVTAITEEGQVLESPTWSFFNAGSAVADYAPFSATLISPSIGEVFGSTTSRVDLQWEGEDLDDDILNYEIYFGNETNPTNLLSTISNEFIEVTVSTGFYYWQIKSIDEIGNSSMSEIFWFKVE